MNAAPTAGGNEPDTPTVKDASKQLTTATPAGEQVRAFLQRADTSLKTKL